MVAVSIAKAAWTPGLTPLVRAWFAVAHAIPSLHCIIKPQHQILANTIRAFWSLLLTPSLSLSLVTPSDLRTSRRPPWSTSTHHYSVTSTISQPIPLPPPNVNFCFDGYHYSILKRLPITKLCTSSPESHQLVMLADFAQAYSGSQPCEKQTRASSAFAFHCQV